MQAEITARKQDKIERVFLGIIEISIYFSVKLIPIEYYKINFKGMKNEL